MPGTITEFPSNGDVCRGYLAKSAFGKGPGIIVIQEWWGLVEHIKQVADRLAIAGFTALAPDLYHGKTTKSPDEAGKLFMALNIDRAAEDLRGAIQYLLSSDATTGKKVGTVGFCMGGQLSLYAACSNAAVGACVNYYGIHPNVHPEIASLEAPVLGFFAEKDGFVTPEVVRRLEAQLTDAGKRAEFHIYPGVGHAFCNDTRTDVYNKTFADQSWNRMLQFFQQHLSSV